MKNAADEWVPLPEEVLNAQLEAHLTECEGLSFLENPPKYEQRELIDVIVAYNRCAYPENQIQLQQPKEIRHIKGILVGMGRVGASVNDPERYEGDYPGGRSLSIGFSWGLDLGNNLEVKVEGIYGKHSGFAKEQQFSLTNRKWEIKHDYMVLHALLKYKLFNAAVRPYAIGGIGAGSNLSSQGRFWEQRVFEPEGKWEAWENLDWKGMFGFNAGIGLSIPLSRQLDLFGEVKWINLINAKSKGRLSGSADLNGLSVYLGVEF